MHAIVAIIILSYGLCETLVSIIGINDIVITLKFKLLLIFTLFLLYHYFILWWPSPGNYDELKMNIWEILVSSSPGFLFYPDESPSMEWEINQEQQIK